MNEGFDYLETANKLARYFARHETSSDASWTAGRVAAEAWHAALLQSDLPTETLIDLDLLMIEGSGETSTAWEELNLAYRAWRDNR